MNDLNLIQRALAERLSLTVKPGGLEGRLGGAPVQVRMALTRPHHHHHGTVAVLDLKSGTIQPVAAEPLQLQIDVTLPFVPRLDARLRVDPVGGYEALRTAGRTGFDGRFVVAGAEPDRAEALVPPAAREALDRAFVGEGGVTVSDGGIAFRWQRFPPYPTVDEVAAALETLPPAWLAITAAARTVRPPTGLEEALVALARVALPEGVDLRGAPAGLAGELDGVPVAVTVAPHVSGGWLVRASVWFPTLLPGAPKVVREDRFGWVERLMATLGGRSEIVVGDAAFDRRFAVRSLRPDALKEALRKEIRTGMLALDALAPVTLSATGLEASGTVKDVARLQALAESTLALAAHVAARG